ncbi:MAG: MFS transporter [Anaerolineales bacterium]|nr:MFS transporter [Anaerolineales bacterium]
MRILKFISYSFGNFANTIAYQVFGNRINFYYVDVLGLNASIAGILWSIYGLWNAINDPLMGQLSDKTRSRFGRRVPYVAFGAIPLGLSFFFLWTPPTQSPWVLAAYFLMILFIFDTLYSLTIIAYNSLFTEVAPTPRDRIDLSATREILATVALLASFILAPIIAEEVGYFTMGAIMGTLIAVGYLIAMIGVKERPIDETKEQSLGLGQSLKLVLSNHAFRWFLGANISKEYIWLLLAAMLPFWRKYALGIQGEVDVFGISMSGGDAEAVLLGLPILLAIPTLLLWRPFLAKNGYRKTWIIGTLTFIPGLLVMTFARDFYTGLLGTMLIIPGLANSMIMPFPVISEIIDDDAKQEHGFRREGLFFGMNGGIVKLAFSAQGILFAIVTAMTGFAEGSDVQTESAIWGIRFLIGITPIIAALLIALCMWKYPLGRDTNLMKEAA